ncbi:glycosyltransferase involved in cell wall biosynthesis [Paraburkholderia sp. WC7.3g]|uniref:glycosyltransferase family 4 protein n=1 Tax=Paraburkholderia sp. WC7.3g TaxID=2991070 RepID=UPI003D20B2BB
MGRVVAIDGHNLALQHGTGVATYARNLANSIQDMRWKTWTLYGAPISPRTPELLREIAFFDFLGGASRRRSKLSQTLAWAKEPFIAPMGYQAVGIPLTGSVETRRFAGRLPRESEVFNIDDLFHIARRYFQRYKKFLEVRFPNPPDVMHWTYPMPIKAAGIPNIYTIHDLVPLRLPYTTLDNKRYYHRMIKGCIEGGDHICTVSEKSKEDIIRLFGASESDITNTYQAVETAGTFDRKSQRETELEVEGIYGLAPRSYFLFFGAIEPKKNVGRLIEAFLSTRLDAKLVIVGSLAWKSDEEMKLVNGMLKQRPSLSKRIHIFDYAPRPFLVSLIRSAKAVVFPSLYEGFGLPILEAMQLGTPTLCSTEGSLPEIAGSASVRVDPYDVSAIAQGLRLLDQDAGLREDLRIAGLERATTFGPGQYREKLLDMYQKTF